MHPLGRLITERMEHPDHRWSVRDVERRAREQGEALNRSTISQLRHAMTPSITRANVFGLAAGLGVTPLTIANAALESWGIATRPAEVTDTLATVAIDPSLSERDRRQLQALVINMREHGTNETAKGRPDVVDAAQKSDAPPEVVKGQEALTSNGKPPIGRMNRRGQDPGERRRKDGD